VHFFASLMTFIDVQKQVFNKNKKVFSQKKTPKMLKKGKKGGGIQVQKELSGRKTAFFELNRYRKKQKIRF